LPPAPADDARAQPCRRRCAPAAGMDSTARRSAFASCTPAPPACVPSQSTAAASKDAQQKPTQSAESPPSLLASHASVAVRRHGCCICGICDAGGWPCQVLPRSLCSAFAYASSHLLSSVGAPAQAVDRRCSMLPRQARDAQGLAVPSDGIAACRLRRRHDPASIMCQALSSWQARSKHCVLSAVPASLPSLHAHKKPFSSVRLQCCPCRRIRARPCMLIVQVRSTLIERSHVSSPDAPWHVGAAWLPPGPCASLIAHERQ
jgi:hypothetical protein